MTPHVGDRLIPHLRGELPEREAREVQAHLEACAACDGERAGFERLAADLARDEPPHVHWGAYRAELRDRLDRRGGRRAGAAGGWPWRPVPAALAAGLVAALLYVGLPGGRAPSPGDPAGLENVMLASRLDLIARLDLVQRLDLLEDLDVIRGLDRLPLRGEG